MLSRFCIYCWLAMTCLVFFGQQPATAQTSSTTNPPVNIAIPAGATDVMANGAVGDCKTDDSAAINGAIAYLSNPNGEIHTGEVYFPKPPGGCYLIGQPIVLPPHYGSGSAVITLLGEGAGVSVIRAGAKMEAVLIAGSLSSWHTGDTITDMTFDANGAANYAIDIQGGSGFKIARVEGLNAVKSDLEIDGNGHNDGENFVSDSLFQNNYNVQYTGAPYNVFIGPGSSSNDLTNNVEVNGRYSNIYNSGNSSHFTGNHGFGYPYVDCPLYAFVASYLDVWTNNQIDCATGAGFYINNWNVTVTNNIIQGVGEQEAGGKKVYPPGVCVSSKTGGSTITANVIATAADDLLQPELAIVQSNADGSCTNGGVPTSTWGNNQNNGASNVVLNNTPASHENIWNMLYVSNPSSSLPNPGVSQIGIGTSSPHATLDINGFARLAMNSGAPAKCTIANIGAIALNSAGHICECNGTLWSFDSNGQACTW